MNLIMKMFRNNNVKAGSFYLVGNLFNKAIVFLTIPLFTRMMSTSDYGIVNTYLSWVSIFSVIIGLSLGESIRSIYAEIKDNVESYLSSIFFLALINFVLTSGIIIFLVYNYFNHINLLLVTLCLIQSFMTFIINSINVLYMMKLQYKKRTVLLSTPNIIISIMSVIYLSFIINDKYLGRIIPYVLITALFGGYYLLKYFIKGKVLIDKRYWKTAISLSLPLIFHGLSINILATSDRTMIMLFRDASQAGIYSLVYSMTMISTVVTSSMESVWIPWFTKKMELGDKKDRPATSAPINNIAPIITEKGIKYL